MRIRKIKILTILCVALIPAASVLCFSLPVAAAGCSPFPTNEGTASTTFTITTTGTYRLWAHVYSPISDSGAIDLAIDGNCSVNVGSSALPAGTFNWLGYTAGTTTPITLDLRSGTHNITLAGEAPSIGVDEVLLTTNTSCEPTDTGDNCAASPTVLARKTPPTGSSSRTKPMKGKPSVLKLVADATSVAVIAALLSSALIYYASRPRNLFGRIPLFKNKFQEPPQDPEGMPRVFTTPGVQRPQALLRRKSTIILLSIGIGVTCGLITSIALAAADYNIIITFSDTKASGQAKVVTNEHALTGQMVQFGSGSTAVPTSPTAAVMPSTSAKQESKTSTSSTSPGSGTSSSSGSGSGSTGNSSTTCTHPTFSSSGAEDTDNTDPSDGHQYYWVNNDAWSGSHGPQTLNVCNETAWDAVSTQPNNGGQVETYPDTEYDVGGRDTPSTKTIAQLTTLTSTFAETYPAAGSWDAAYDLWTNNWRDETMVWNQWTGTEDFWGNCAEPGPSQNTCGEQPAQAASIDGVGYHFLALGSNCAAATEANCEYIFFRDAQVAAGSVNLLAVYQWEVAHGFAKASDVPTQLEYGVEICSTSGTETFPMNGLTFTVD